MSLTPAHKNICDKIAMGWPADKAGQAHGIFCAKAVYRFMQTEQWQTYIEQARTDPEIRKARVIQATAVHEAIAERLDAHDMSVIYDDFGKIRPISEWPLPFRKRLKKIEYDGKTGRLTKVEFSDAQKDIDMAARVAGAYQPDRIELVSQSEAQTPTEQDAEQWADAYALTLGR